MWGMGTKNRRYCTMYKKVLYNIKKIKKKCGGGEGQYLNPKHYVFKKEKEKKVEKKNKLKKFDRAGIRTHNLRVRNPLG